MDKYVWLRDDAYNPRWSFLKDDEELELWRTDSSIEDGDYIIEIKSIKRASEKKTIEILIEEEKA